MNTLTQEELEARRAYQRERYALNERTHTKPPKAKPMPRFLIVLCQVTDSGRCIPVPGHALTPENWPALMEQLREGRLKLRMFPGTVDQTDLLARTSDHPQVKGIRVVDAWEEAA